MHPLRIICQLGLFQRKKSEMSQMQLFAVAINTAGGQKQYCSSGGHSVLGSVRPDTLVRLLSHGALDRSLVKTGIMTSPVQSSDQDRWCLEAPHSCGFNRLGKNICLKVARDRVGESGPWIALHRLTTLLPPSLSFHDDATGTIMLSFQARQGFRELKHNACVSQSPVSGGLCSSDHTDSARLGCDQPPPAYQPRDLPKPLVCFGFFVLSWTGELFSSLLGQGFP